MVAIDAAGGIAATVKIVTPPRMVVGGSDTSRAEACLEMLRKAPTIGAYLAAREKAGMGATLPAFDAALCASGTASLECALARAVPVVCYRVGWATELGARMFVTTPHVALPNILLGRGAFPELLQRQATTARMSEELANALEHRESFLEPCAEVELALDGQRSASHNVARMLEPWLATRAA